jgi:hypothetical protein
MSYAILLRLDSAGACPVLLREDAELLTSDKGVRWRFVAETDDHVEAVRLVEMLQQRCQAGEV